MFKSSQIFSYSCPRRRHQSCRRGFAYYPAYIKQTIIAAGGRSWCNIIPQGRAKITLTNWLGDSFQSTKVLFTSNLSTNGAIMVQKGLAYSIVIEGAVPFWDKEKIAYRPLYPELAANSVLVWKKQQPFTLAAGKFIEHIKCFLGISGV